MEKREKIVGPFYYFGYAKSRVAKSVESTKFRELVTVSQNLTNLWERVASSWKVTKCHHHKMKGSTLALLRGLTFMQLALKNWVNIHPLSASNDCA